MLAEEYYYELLNWLKPKLTDFDVEEFTYF